MVRLVSCELVRGNDGDNLNEKEAADDVGRAQVVLLLAQAKMYRAEAERLEMERSVLDDLGSLIKELASEAEAKAKIAQADRDTHELVQEAVRKLKVGERSDLLLVEQARCEIERNIARSRDQAMKAQRPQNTNPGRQGGQQQRRGPMPQPPEREVNGGNAGRAQGEGGQPFNAIKGAAAQAAMKTESKT